MNKSPSQVKRDTDAIMRAITPMVRKMAKEIAEKAAGSAIEQRLHFRAPIDVANPIGAVQVQRKFSGQTAQTVSGSRGVSAALTSLITALGQNGLGIIIDNTTP